MFLVLRKLFISISSCQLNGNFVRGKEGFIRLVVTKDKFFIIPHCNPKGSAQKILI